MTALYRGSIEQKVRLITGLILFTFALTHFLNHALGLYSIEVMQIAEKWRFAVTRTLFGSVVLGGAAIIHILLGLKKLAFRSTLKMPFWEAAQVCLGLLIPLLLIPHLVAMRFSYELFGTNTTYLTTLLKVWRGFPIQQSVLLLIVWMHACIGLHFWLRLSKWYEKLFQLMFALAVIIPLAGIAGYAVSSRVLEEKIAIRQLENSLPDESSGYSSDYGQSSKETGNGYGYDNLEKGYDYASEGTSQIKPEQVIAQWTDAIEYTFWALLGLCAIIYASRMAWHRYGGQLEIGYAQGPTIRARAGPTLLEISRMNGVPHASVCGGRGRCSTCRVRIEEGGDQLGPRNAVEERTLASVNAGPNDRLACQIRPNHKLSVIRIIQPTATALKNKDYSGSKARGEERELAVLFLDVRGFTSMSAGKLPYDVVFILNQLFDATGEAIQSNGGWIDKYLGDGLMAVFGRESSAELGSRQALRAAREIDIALDEVNNAIGDEAGGGIKIGMGIHVGPLILGEIGHRGSSVMTVIGRTVNAAARLEALTKTMGCQLIISSDVALRAELPPLDQPKETVEVRGIPEPLDVICFSRARDLPE